MAEKIGKWIVDPSIDSIVDESVDFLIQNFIPKLAEEAHNIIMIDWDKQRGYSSGGSSLQWTRSPKSKRKNPILFDTGVLKSSIDIVFFDGGADFRFEASGGSQYISGATVEEVSSYNSNNPHTNIPKEYMVGGSERQRLMVEFLKDFYRMKISDNSIRLA